MKYPHFGARMALLKCVRFQRKLYRSGRFLSRFCASIAQKLALIECYQVVHISRLFTENGIEFFEKAKKNPFVVVVGVSSVN